MRAFVSATTKYSFKSEMLEWRQAVTHVDRWSPTCCVQAANENRAQIERVDAKHLWSLLLRQKLKEKLKKIEVYERCFACRASAREVWWRDRTPANTHPGWSAPLMWQQTLQRYQHIGTLCLVA